MKKYIQFKWDYNLRIRAFTSALIFFLSGLALSGVEAQCVYCQDILPATNKVYWLASDSNKIDRIGVIEITAYVDSTILASGLYAIDSIMRDSLAAHLTLIGTKIGAGDNISLLVNDLGYISWTPAQMDSIFTANGFYTVDTDTKWSAAQLDSIFEANGFYENLAEVLLRGNDAGAQQIKNVSDPTANQDAATKKYVDDNDAVNDADSDPNNEIQDLQDVIEQDSSAGNHRIINVTDPVSDQDAATKKYVDDNDAVNDADSDPNNEIQDLQDVIEQDSSAGNHRIINVTDPVSDQDAATKKYVDDNDAVNDADSDPNNEIQDLQDVIEQDSSAGNHRIINVTDPVSDQDAATKKYVDDNDSVNDADSDPNNEIQDLQDVIEQDSSAGNHRIINVTDPVSDQDAATKKYVDDNDAVNDADSDPNNEIQDLQDVIEQDSSAGNHRIINVTDPVSDQDAATKKYVDDNDAVNDADSDPNNEIQDLQDVIEQDSSAGNHRIINVTDPVSDQDAATKKYVDDNDSVNDADSDPNNEIQDLQDVIEQDSSAGNHRIINVTDPVSDQDAATKKYVDDNDAVNDADSDPNNEIQTLGGSTGTITLSDGGGNFVLPDSSATNEFQAISISNDTIFLANGGFVKLPLEVDGSTTNEIQALSISNDTIFLVNGGFAKLPPDDSETDDQKIDTFLISGDTLFASLEADGEPGKFVLLAPYLDNTDTQLSREQVEDFAGAMVTGNTETLITVTYQDGDGTTDFAVEPNLSNYTNDAGFLTSETDNQKIDTFSISGDTLFASLETDGEPAKFVLLSSYLDNTDTQLTQEQVEDFAGALVANGTGTHTGIAVTYQDATGHMDLIIDHDAATNFVAGEHILHSGVTITAGDALSGGGDISATRTIDLDPSEMPGQAPDLADILPYEDVTDAGIHSMTLTQLQTAIDTDTDTQRGVTDQANGLDITLNGNNIEITHDPSESAGQAPDLADIIIIEDVTDGGIHSATLTQLQTAIDTDANTLGPDGDKGDITVGGTGTTLTIDADAVTYAKIQNVVADQRLLGNIAGAGGIVAELTPEQVRVMLGLDEKDVSIQAWGDKTVVTIDSSLVVWKVGPEHDNVTIRELSWFSNSFGTSVDIQLVKNGTAVTLDGDNTYQISTADSTFNMTNLALTDGDRLQFKCTAVVGATTGLTFTLEGDYEAP